MSNGESIDDRLKLEQAYVANRDSYRELNFLREVGAFRSVVCLAWQESEGQDG